MNFREVLQNFKFTEHEMIIYEFILKNDTKSLSVKEISSALKITPSTVYRIMDGFIGKGLCSMSYDYFNIKSYKAQINDQIKPFFLINDKTILPETEFFFGFDDMKKLYEDTITEDDIFALINNDNLEQTFLSYLTKHYVPARALANTNAYVIASPFSSVDKYSSDDTECLRDTKITKKIFNYGEMNIYGDKIMIASVRQNELIGVRIKNAFIANSMKAMFDISWEAL